MKKILPIIAFVLLTVLGQTFAQVKVGYASAEAVLGQLPEAKTIDAELKAYSAQLSKEMETKQKEFETKYQDYVKNNQTMAVVVREQREKELQTMNQSLQEFQQKAQQDLEKKRGDLLTPVFEKIQKAIDEISKAENFDFVFSTDASGVPILLFAKEEHNITNKVITKLGGTPIPATKPTTTNTTPEKKN
jgi:outer membrane protein